MISDLRITAQKIVSERNQNKNMKHVDWTSFMENRFRQLDRKVESKCITKEEAVRMAAKELGIENNYEKHYKELEHSIR